MTVAFDTLEAARDLEAAGFEQRQAETLARLLRKTRELDLTHIATKEDLERTKNDILRWMFGIAVGQFGLTVALIKLI